jgi:hypothetical protein
VKGALYQQTRMVAIDVLVALTLWKRQSRIIFLGRLSSNHLISQYLNKAQWKSLIWKSACPNALKEVDHSDIFENNKQVQKLKQEGRPFNMIVVLAMVTKPNYAPFHRHIHNILT